MSADVSVTLPVPVRRPDPGLRTSIAVLAVGLLVGLPTAVVAGLTIWHTVFSPVVTTPGTVHRHLDEGTYTLFEHVSEDRQYGPLSIRHGHGVTLDRSEVSVPGPGGTPVPTRNSDGYASAVDFDVAHAGSDTIRIGGTRPGKVMITRRLGDTVRAHAGWIVAGGTGWLIALAGMAMLLVGVIRRGRADRRAQVPPPLLPAAWCPDPWGEARLRYWDGNAWTGHTAE